MRNTPRGRVRLLTVLSVVVLVWLAGCSAPAAPAVPTNTVSAPKFTPAATVTTEAEAPTATAPAASQAPFTITDALDRQVTFEKPPERIVLTGKALFMVADAVYLFPEAGQRVIALGKTAQSALDFIPVVDAAYKDKTILESEAGPEQIAALQPEVVLLKSSNSEKLGTPLEAMGIPVVYVDFETPEQYQRDLTTLGQLFGNPARAEQLAAFYRSRLETITQTVAGVKDEQKPSVLLMYYSDRDGTVAFNVPPLSWMQTIMVETAGGAPAWKDAQLGKGWTKVGLEQIAAWDADQIYIAAYFNPVDEVIEKLNADPQWQGVRAVQEGQLYAFPGDYYSWDQPDARWILGLSWLASKVQPAFFPAVQIEQEARTFYQELYQLDDATFDAAVKPHLVGDVR